MILVLLSALLGLLASRIILYYLGPVNKKARTYQFWRRGIYYIQQGGNPSCIHDNSDMVGANLNKCLDCGALVNISRHPYLRG